MLLNKKYQIKTCKSFLSQARGLMFSRKKNLLFINKKEKKYPLHMFFVFFPIDIIFLDKTHTVLKKVRAHPFEPFIKGEKSKYVLEMAEKNNIKIGEKLKFC
jgi:uncharacterized membrane protein (UPF0127 family)